MRLTNEIICYITNCIIITFMYFNSFTFVPRKKSEVVIKNGQSRDTGTTRHNPETREQLDTIHRSGTTRQNTQIGDN
jgi:hypothetical protein